MTQPNFLVVGAGKAGTTWLHVCLEEHPAIFVPAGKEIHYFTRYYDRGLAWYESFFERRNTESAVGESSPTYMWDPVAAERIAYWNPDVSLIFVVRNPIERAYSHYCMHLRGGRVRGEIESELSLDSRYATEGLYFRQIERFLHHFPVEQTKLLFYDDLKQNAHRFLKDVYSFLNVDPSFSPAISDRRYHVTKGRPRFQRTYNGAVSMVTSLSARSDWAQRSIEQLRRRGIVDVLHRLNRGPEFPPLGRSKRQELAAFYAEDVAALSQWSGRNLSTWLAPSEIP